jgi:hypothetical protein
MPHRGDRWTLGAALMVGAATLVVVVLALSESGRGSVAPSSPLATTSPSPPPSFPDHALYAVSCAGAGDCWAVGFSSSVNGTGQPLIEHYAGSRWAIVGTTKSYRAQSSELHAEPERHPRPGVAGRLSLSAGSGTRARAKRTPCC